MTVRRSSGSPSRLILTSARSGADAFVLDPERDRLRLADDAEARCGDDHDTAVALVGDAADEGVNGRGESERAGVGGHVVNPAVGDEDRARHAVRRHVGERRVERGEQAGAVGLAVGLAGLHHPHLDAGNALQALGHGGAGGFGLGGALAEILARALVDDDHRDRGQGIAVLAGERGVCERKHEQRQRRGAQQAAPAA